MTTITAAQWLVLDNLAHGWHYWCNLDRAMADDAYLWAVRNEFVRDGAITNAGLGALLAYPMTKEPTP